jgi:hypothetical protein
MANIEAARGNTRMRFEQWARNPTCEANTFSAVHNVRMADVARSVGVQPSFGQSPFAIARGQDFESSLFARDAERFIEELIKVGVLPSGSHGFLDLRLRMNRGKRIVTLDEAIEVTGELLRNVASDPRGNHPSVVAGATVRIPRGVMLPEANLIIDALVLRTDLDPPELVVGEIKSFPDRGGYTLGAELAAARAQAGLYVHALELVAASLGISQALSVSHHGFLVLTRPGSNWPSIRAGEDLAFQAARAARGFDLLEEAAVRLPGFIADDDEPLADQLARAVLSSEHRYSEECLSFCDLAPRCHAEALERGDAIVLGNEMRRFVGGISLPRVEELLDGSEPRDATERDLVRRVREVEEVVVP